jgi:hypothetical protein
MRNMPDFSVSKEEALAMTVAVLASKAANYPEDWMVRPIEQEVYSLPEDSTQEQ